MVLRSLYALVHAFLALFRLFLVRVEHTAALRLRHRDTFVDQSDLHAAVQKGDLSQTLFHRFEVERRFRENGSVRLKADIRTRAVGGNTRVLQGAVGDPCLHLLFAGIVLGMETHFIDALIAAYFYRQPFGKRVGNGRAYAVQTARIFVIPLSEFTACMQFREYELYARNLFLGVNIGGDPSPVVLYGGASVRVQRHFNSICIAVCRFVDRVVHDFPKNVVQPFDPRRADIHTRTHTNSLETFQDLKVAGGVFLCFLRRFFQFCHFVLNLYVL